MFISTLKPLKSFEWKNTLTRTILSFSVLTSKQRTTTLTGLNPPAVVLCLWVSALPGLFGAGPTLTLPSAFLRQRFLLVQFCFTLTYSCKRPEF